MMSLVLGQGGVDHGPAGGVGAVPDKIYPGYGLPSLQDFFCPVPKAQLR